MNETTLDAYLAHAGWTDEQVDFLVNARRHPLSPKFIRLGLYCVKVDSIVFVRVEESSRPPSIFIATTSLPIKIPFADAETCRTAFGVLCDFLART